MTEQQQQALNNLASIIQDYVGHLGTLGHPTAASAVRAMAQRCIQVLQEVDYGDNKNQF